jgi:hypothetical protein
MGLETDTKVDLFWSFSLRHPGSSCRCRELYPGLGQGFSLLAQEALKRLRRVAVSPHFVTLLVIDLQFFLKKNFHSLPGVELLNCTIIFDFPLPSYHFWLRSRIPLQSMTVGELRAVSCLQRISLLLLVLRYGREY